MTDTVEELAARCEAATGPDRELDARIHCEARGWTFTQEGNDFIAIVPGIIKSIENRLWIGQLDPTQIPRSYTSRTDALSPAYTASLDAAMTLVPTDPETDGPMVWALDTNTFVGCEASIYLTDNDAGPEILVEAATPALALCAAALRARSKDNG